MNVKRVLAGTVHKELPNNFKKILKDDPVVLDNWENLTPLARNEWICWITFPKQQKTKVAHIERAIEDLKNGKKRPCCWIGCIHRNNKELSPSVKGILKKRGLI